MVVVPETDVLVKGAWEIDHVFGGGNGKDKFKKGNQWILNEGANVGSPTTPGNTNTLLIGGYIHEAYGGSNEKGTIWGNATINTDADADCACALELVKLYGAGKNADIEGDLIVVLECAPETKTEEIYGGAENANVKGNVELTITSGSFGKVFGGNNQSGAIFGHIRKLVVVRSISMSSMVAVTMRLIRFMAIRTVELIMKVTPSMYQELRRMMELQRRFPSSLIPIQEVRAMIILR